MLHKKSVIHFLTIITSIYVLYYLYWRIEFTLNYAALAFSILLLAGEVIGIIDYYLFALMTWNTNTEKPGPPEEGLSVDVFIPTYNEDLAILEATLIGCRNMWYPHTTYVLDDGRRQEVKELAAALGCRYLTRPDNKHAKAGNINEALKKTSGEFIAIMDADMVPQPDFLEKTLGYFKDSKTAIVQLPQEFYNTDSMQHTDNGAHWHEQQLFYHVIQPGKNNINAAFWCGSPSVVRRKALESIGGVATESITEDFFDLYQA
jgi:cellulose synthase (UDP-forming)